MTNVHPLIPHDDTPWLAPGVLDLRARFGKIIDIGEQIKRPFIVEMVGVALWNMTQVDGRMTVFSSVQSTLRAWRIFCDFLDSDIAEGWPEPHCSQELTPHHFIRAAAYFVPRYPTQVTRSGLFYLLTGCLHALRANQPEQLAPNFTIPLFPERLATIPGARRTPYTEEEMFKIVRICRKEIAAITHRFREGKKLTKAGIDPSGRKPNAWLSQANVLWYVRHVLNGAPYLASCVDRSAHSSLGAAFSKHKAGYPSKDDTYRYLYPSLDDLIPFLLLLHAQLDENQQCILNLTINDVAPMEDSRFCRIRFVKTRPARKEFFKTYGNASIWSPGRLIRMFELITAPLRQWAHDPLLKSHLWVYLGRRTEAVNTLFGQDPSRAIAAFGKKNGIPDLQLSRFRVTNLSRAYRRTGSLALIKDRARHSQMQTTVHYLTNPGTHDLHYATIATAQQEALSLLAGAIVVPTPNESEASILSENLRLETGHAKRIIDGEQDVFIASCRDFYNRPDGPQNSPCDRPFACFSCRNAIWTSRMLPRLIRFRDFLEQQRTQLPSDEWQIRFGFPFRAITEAILPAFPPEVIAVAEAAAPDEVFHVPATMRGS